MRHNLSTALRELLRTFAQPLDPYRPELHYMRGPGPKCRAKCSGAAVPAAPVSTDAVASLGEIAQARA